MSTLSFPYTHAAGQKIKSAELNANNNAVSTFLNTTKINDDNIQTGGVGTASVADGAITNAKVSASAAIALSKLANPTVTTTTSNYTALTTDDVILISASGGARTVTLYAASGNSGKMLRIKKTDSTNNVVTVDGASSETIDGAATKKLATQYEDITLVCDGSNWHLLDRCIPSVWTSYTPTGSWSANSPVYTGRWRRIGDSIEVQATVTQGNGAATSASLTINLPTGLTIDTAKLTSTTRSLPNGAGNINDNSTGTNYAATPFYSSTTAVLVVADDSDDAAGYTILRDVTATVPITFANADIVNVSFTAPITDWEG